MRIVLRWICLRVFLLASITLSLKRECEKLPAEGWSAHVNQNAYDGCWDVIPLRVAAQHVD
jgi:hypothetical protein